MPERENEVNYRSLYAILFNAISDALMELDDLNIGKACDILVAAQQQTELGFTEQTE